METNRGKCPFLCIIFIFHLLLLTSDIAGLKFLTSYETVLLVYTQSKEASLGKSRSWICIFNNSRMKKEVLLGKEILHLIHNRIPAFISILILILLSKSAEQIIAVKYFSHLKRNLVKNFNKTCVIHSILSICFSFSQKLRFMFDPRGNISISGFCVLYYQYFWCTEDILWCGFTSIGTLKY